MSRKVPYQYHFGRQFYEDKRTGYWISSDLPRIRAHRWVWINSNGQIPKSCHIHHRDGNKGNNDISNLQMVSFKQHAMLHMDSERLDGLRKLAEIGREYAKGWHKSAEGRKWHQYHALKNGFGKYEGEQRVCRRCANEFRSKAIHNAFCSNACKSAWRRDEGLDDVEKTCDLCGTTFRSNKYSKNKYCSRKCGVRSRFVKKP